MKRLFLSALIAFAIGPLLGGCDVTSHSGTPTAMTDSQLEDNIRAKLNSDAQLNAANLGISANAARNEATLTGPVQSQESRARAVDLAKGAHPGLLIIDKLTVQPREPTRAEYTEDQARSARMKAKDFKEKIGDSLDDAWIHTKIVAKLIRDADTPERKINVDVVNNIVTLRGTVDTPAQKSEAERIARATEGVKSVNNQLKVSRQTGS
jgi:hyperosmotically inducible protein